MKTEAEGTTPRKCLKKKSSKPFGLAMQAPTPKAFKLGLLISAFLSLWSGLELVSPLPAPAAKDAAYFRMSSARLRNHDLRHHRPTARPIA